MNVEEEGTWLAAKWAESVRNAAHGGDTDGLRRLLDRPPPTMPTPDALGGALCHAAGQARPDAVRLLLHAGALPDYQSSLGASRATPLQYIASFSGMRGQQEAGKEADWVASARLLLDAGADIALGSDDKGETLLGQFADGGSAALVRLLLEAGARPDGADPARTPRRHRTAPPLPLHGAARAASAPVVALLLEAGADPNRVMPPRDQTPLHLACDALQSRMAGGGDPAACVRLLLAAGADLAPADREGYTPLHRAAASGAADETALLLEAGAPVHTVAANRTGAAPLWLALYRPDVGAARAARVAGLLLKHGADPGPVAADGTAPLYLALLHKRIRAARLLLAAGAPTFPLAPPEGGTPALHLAVETGRADLATALVAAGHRPDDAYRSKTARDVARAKGRADVIAALGPGGGGQGG